MTSYVRGQTLRSPSVVPRFTCLWGLFHVMDEGVLAHMDRGAGVRLFAWSISAGAGRGLSEGLQVTSHSDILFPGPVGWTWGPLCTLPRPCFDSLPATWVTNASQPWELRLPALGCQVLALPALQAASKCKADPGRLSPALGSLSQTRGAAEPLLIGPLPMGHPCRQTWFLRI